MVIITGGTKGIGRALVERFAQAQKNIVVCARNETDLAALKSETEANYSVNVHTKVTDVSDKAAVLEFGQFVLEKDEPIEVLINNAGVFIPGAVHEEEDGTLETMIETNLYSAYHLTRQLLPEMMTEKSGDIFNICSIASLIAYPNGGSYSISKFAMYGMSKALREEMKPHGIRVFSVMPGATYTASWEGADISEDRLMPASDIAELVFATHQLTGRSVVEDLVIRPQLGDL